MRAAPQILALSPGLSADLSADLLVLRQPLYSTTYGLISARILWGPGNLPVPTIQRLTHIFINQIIYLSFRGLSTKVLHYIYSFEIL